MAGSGCFQDFQNSNSNCPYLNLILNTLLPFFHGTNGTSVNSEHPSFHFGTFYPKILYKISFYSFPNSAIYHCFRTWQNLFLLNCCCLQTLKLSNILKASFKLPKRSTIAKYILCTIFFMPNQG